MDDDDAGAASNGRDDAWIQQRLDAGVPADKLAQRSGAGGQKVTYMEGAAVIETANEIFGFRGWSSNVIDVSVDFSDQDAKGQWSIGVTAIVRVTVGDGVAYHEDLGFSEGNGRSRGDVFGGVGRDRIRRHFNMPSTTVSGDL